MTDLSKNLDGYFNPHCILPWREYFILIHTLCLDSPLFFFVIEFPVILFISQMVLF